MVQCVRPLVSELLRPEGRGEVPVFSHKSTVNIRAVILGYLLNTMLKKRKPILEFVALFLTLFGTTAFGQTAICTNFDHLSAKNMRVFSNLHGFENNSKSFYDWDSDAGYSSDTKEIIIAISKRTDLNDLPCIAEAGDFVPAAFDLVIGAKKTVGKVPDWAVKASPDPNVPLVGPTLSKRMFAEHEGVSLQVIVSREVEPVRTLGVIERYFGFDYGYCEENNNCGLELERN